MDYAALRPTLYLPLVGFPLTWNAPLRAAAAAATWLGRSASKALSSWRLDSSCSPFPMRLTHIGAPLLPRTICCSRNRWGRHEHQPTSNPNLIAHHCIIPNHHHIPSHLTLPHAPLLGIKKHLTPASQQPHSLTAASQQPHSSLTKGGPGSRFLNVHLFHCRSRLLFPLHLFHLIILFSAAAPPAQ